VGAGTVAAGAVGVVEYVGCVDDCVAPDEEVVFVEVGVGDVTGGGVVDGCVCCLLKPNIFNSRPKRLPSMYIVYPEKLVGRYEYPIFVGTPVGYGYAVAGG